MEEQQSALREALSVGVYVIAVLEATSGLKALKAGERGFCDQANKPALSIAGLEAQVRKLRLLRGP